MYTIQVLDTDGTHVSYIGLNQQEGGGYLQELSSPGGIDLARDGKTLAVADTGNNRWENYTNVGRTFIVQLVSHNLNKKITIFQNILMRNFVSPYMIVNFCGLLKGYLCKVLKLNILFGGE